MNHWSSDQPPMTRVRRSKEEARVVYDRMSGWYDLLAGPSEEKHVEAGLRKFNAQAGERILEIGFGTGHALVSLARSVGLSGRVYGVDISEGMARRARGKLERTGLGDAVELICGDGARLPLRDIAVDGIFMSFALELFDTPRIPLVLGEGKRVLREEGRLCVVSLAKRGTGSLPVRVYEWVHERIPRYVDCRPIPVEQVLERAGFEIEDVDRRSMWGLPVDVVLGRKESGPNNPLPAAKR
jgi:demethylmenaquinone methyltransferase/2-methoxy-6-polyprenyl-1,4-benzoquinol methylase